MTTEDPGLGWRPIAPPLGGPLADLERQLAAAIETTNRIARIAADGIRDVQAANARAKEWADIAYEMWALLVNSRHAGFGGAAEPAQWANQKNALRERLHAALDTMPEDVKP